MSKELRKGISISSYDQAAIISILWVIIGGSEIFSHQTPLTLSSDEITGNL